MGTTKLTLSADKDLIQKAKKLAEREGTSISSMFSRFLLATLRERSKDFKPGPMTRKATGLAKFPSGKSDRALLEEALAHKYGR